MYNRVQIRLHWLVAALVGGQFLLQGAMHRAMERLAASQAVDVTGFLITTWHSLAGLSIGVFMMWRWALRRRTESVVEGDARPGRLAAMARLNHLSMYAVVALMVISGVLNYHAGLPLAARVHAVGKWLLAVLVSVHVLAALWHHFVRRDAVLRNMLGCERHADTIRKL